MTDDKHDPEASVEVHSDVETEGATEVSATAAAPEGDGAPDDDADIEEAPVFTASQVEQKIAAAKDEVQGRYVRLLAEYENFRKRTAREKEQWSADALSDLVKALLPAFDSLDKAAELGADDAKALADGLAAIRRQVATVLDGNAIEVLDPLHEVFDPQFHEALMRQPSAEHDPGTVLAVFEKGYTIGGRLLRAARVVVAAKPD